MKKAYSIFGATLILILGSGCQTNTGSKAKPPQGDIVGGSPEQVVESQPIVDAPQSRSTEAQFRMAKALLENGNHTEAMKHFAYLRDHADSADERDRAIIGLSMALDEAGMRGAALGALDPLPEMPRTALEARKCVIAGELHLHQKNTALARTWLSRGLEFEPDSQKSYRASAFFNLGKALLAEDNLEDAHVAFQSAQEIFAFNGDEASAKQCAAIADDIHRGLQ